ncbi:MULTISPECIES: sialidase family protein [Legionella]|uniref:BNR/Asp-box repeat containing protein n=1 Tax=Legionella drozanskii LLAP-1 TaxID=1212489 RepID=A0A0W0SRQ1_9GAMM|nr:MULTISPECIES: sialidase family protein [Legionella]KTC85653.1 BNR/Asp-box repeat containing protein [Legionella drozanskii LLAP-1]PJE15143.1 MAG: exo-alpha-sialidase [Legionella sp.]
MKKSVSLALLSMLCVSASGFAEVTSNKTTTIRFNTKLNRLHAVSCDKTATQCIAVGFGAEYHLHERLAYVSQDGGKTWGEPTILTAPKEELTPTLSDDPNSANIHCNDSGQSCKVTSSAIINRIPTPIVYSSQDGGLTWSEPKILPLPKSVNKSQVYKNDSLATSISCDVSGVVCTIVGGLMGDNEALPFVYSTKNAGETWKLYSSLKIPSYQASDDDYHGTILFGVSCNFSGRNCVAVGGSVIATSFFSNYYSLNPIVYHTQDAGEHWSKPIVLPMKETVSSAGALADIACDGSGMQCLTLGYDYDYFTSNYQPYSFITRNGGLDWSDKNFITTKPGKFGLSSIHCDDSGKRCKVVGWTLRRIASIPIVNPLLYTTNDAGKLWEKDTSFSINNSAKFNDIFCNNTGENCIVVGTQVETNNAQLMKQFLKKRSKVNLYKSQKSSH